MRHQLDAYKFRGPGDPSDRPRQLFERSGSTGSNSSLHPGVAITWRDLSVWAEKKITEGVFKKQRTVKIRLLNSVSGYAKAGALTAIMGASGAGKTTLVSTLSRRVTGYKTRGEILVNGKAVTSRYMISISGFAPQQDITVEELTVLEHMQFMAWLKMDARVSDRQKARTVDDVIADIGLRKCLNSQLRFLSGGERRKVALAVQLLTDPPILFCDEPTTGLDSFNARSVMSNLSDLAKQGKTVVCTIHQPSASIFATFDEVILMAAGGRVAFQGTLTGALDHFKSLGLECVGAYNTVEFLISQLSVAEDYRTEEEVNEICDHFSTSKMLNSFENQFNTTDTQLVNGQDATVHGYFLPVIQRRNPSSFQQFRMLCWRNGISNVRKIRQVFSGCFFSWVICIMIAISFRSSMYDEHMAQNLEGMYTFVMTDVAIGNTFSAATVFNEDNPIFKRETKDNIYSVGPYYLTRILFLLGMTVLNTFIYSIMFVWIVGLDTGGLLFFITQFYSPIIACAIASNSLGFFLSSLFESMDEIFFFMVPINDLSNFCSGFYIQLSSLPFYLQWVKYMSRIYYGTEAISILQWTLFEKIYCPETKDLKCFVEAEKVLQKYGYDRSNIYLDFIGLGLMFLIMTAAGYVGLKVRSKQQAYY